MTSQQTATLWRVRLAASGSRHQFPEETLPGQRAQDATATYRQKHGIPDDTLISAYPVSSAHEATTPSQHARAAAE